MRIKSKALFDWEVQNAAQDSNAPVIPPADGVYTRTRARKTPCQDSTAVLEVDEMPPLLPRYTDGDESDDEDDDEDDTPILAMKSVQQKSTRVIPPWLITLLGIPGLILFCTMQIANYMGTPNFHAHVDSTLYQSIGLAERKAYCQHWEDGKISRI